MWRAFKSVYGKRSKRIVGKGSAGTKQEVADILRFRPHDFDVVGGHVYYGIGKNCTQRPYYYFTLFRDPTSVVLSRYFKRSSPEIQEKKARRQRGDFEENLQKLKNRFNIDPATYIRNNSNPLTKYLRGRHALDIEATSEDLELAKEHLRRDYVCFGIVERYAESMELVAKTLGWEHVPQVELRNKGGNRPPKYDPELLELGREVNALDYELYDFAQKLFDEKLAALRS